MHLLGNGSNGNPLEQRAKAIQATARLFNGMSLEKIARGVVGVGFGVAIVVEQPQAMANPIFHQGGKSCAWILPSRSQMIQEGEPGIELFEKRQHGQIPGIGKVVGPF